LTFWQPPPAPADPSLALPDLPLNERRESVALVKVIVSSIFAHTHTPSLSFQVPLQIECPDRRDIGVIRDIFMRPVALELMKTARSMTQVISLSMPVLVYVPVLFVLRRCFLPLASLHLSRFIDRLVQSITGFAINMYRIATECTDAYLQELLMVSLQVRMGLSFLPMRIAVLGLFLCLYLHLSPSVYSYFLQCRLSFLVAALGVR
jgi:hypothetical protein